MIRVEDSLYLSPYVKQLPHPRQEIFLRLKYDEILFGGAVGGGKSSALLMKALQYIDIPGWNAIILRTTRGSMEQPGGLILRSAEWLAETDASWNDTKKAWTFPNGNVLRFGYCEGPRDVFKFSSSEYACALFEELTEFRREHDFTTLGSRLRGPRDSEIEERGIIRVLGGSTNPVGPGFKWVKRRFIDEKHPDRFFLPSMLTDNPTIDREAYMKKLATLTPLQRRKLIEGDWSAGEEGYMFDANDLHIVQPDRLPPMKVHVAFIDHASTPVSESNKDPDWCAIVEVMIDYHDNIYLRAHQNRGDEGATERFIKTTILNIGPSVIVGMEQEGGSLAKQALKYYDTKVLPKYEFHARTTGGKNKVQRAQPLSSQSSHGNVYVIMNEWASELIGQLDSFPNADHDDLVDGSSGGYLLALDVLDGSVYKKRKRRTRR